MFFELFSPARVLLTAALISEVVCQTQHYPITGVSSGVNPQTGARPPRRDILEFQHDVPSFSLYIQSLAAMQAAPESELLSWFQIAGIHGRPYYAWDNVSRVPGAPSYGYCTHGDVLFITWHRPYLALIEQVIVNHAKVIAKEYNNPVYERAADNLRIPFWDWAAKPVRVPDIVNVQTLTIQAPTGTKVVPNPLWTYKFQRFPLNQTEFPPEGGFESFSQTVRQPQNGLSMPWVANDQLGQAGGFLTDTVWNVFAKTSTFNSMSTSGIGGPSFEGPHGTVHVLVGGYPGHMTSVGYAGFDPIFWLHHANVDRQAAMWQAIYPDSYLQPGIEWGGTFTLVPRQTLDTNTPLLPFYTADGTTPWTSTSSRYTKAFGYSYPDVKDWLFTDPAALSANVTARVNQLYNPNGVLTKRTVRGSVTARDTSKSWSLAISVPNAALGESFTVRFFLGEKSTNISAWAETSVGLFSVLSQPLSGGMAPMLTYGEVELTKGLVSKGQQLGATAAVVAYLKANLKWGIQKIDGSVVPNESVTGLDIKVQEQAVTLPAAITEFPEYGPRILHPEATA